MSDLIALAERVESATEPSKQLAAEIRCAVFAPAGSYVEQSPYNGAWCIYEPGREGSPKRSWEARNLTQEQRLGDFTASLDAALSLVPEGMLVCIVNSRVDLPEPDFAKCSALVGTPDDMAGDPVSAATMPLALTAASLRARASSTVALAALARSAQS